ncbi:Stk1 family PASTA domain-containing Ser/Thr kinase [Halobacillus shinanisalinarum]|uniref:non-specific serine/threonine protein kinase n=1 Tax=Halobacillus shinanisalinarum TaxID=2932258 RepID=A0ABY4GYN6_9BACI|nr:Stk1 family PASTA domain-containing Ser/Thr kinase [Halobacillus shinanisalinarum]UOQ93174.1 Stk1 family PASTA domain-containing Ser/Thr kinase [Halobacillus shinanisalinarum]
MLNNRLLNERYKIMEMIGGGGMANVYLAYDTILDRDVAIKVLRLEHGDDEEFIARFHREAQSASSLSHPNIVNIYDVGEEEDLYFMAMEYVDGMTLKQYIQKNSPIDVADAIDIIRQVTSAMAHAHDNGIVHRDIKPQNILIDHYGQVKVTDFGIAMALSATALTQTNSVLGSVHYLSPEQARGGMATKKSDIYSLGIVLFELLTGRLPFSGESPVAIALKHLQHDTPSLKRWIADLPQSVENIVLKATAKDPFHRYDSVMDMEYDLETALEPNRLDEPIFAIPNEEDEEKTKAIPVITEENYGYETEENTIVLDTTKVNSEKNLSKKEKKKAKKLNKKSKKKKKKKKKKRPLLWLFIIFLILCASGVAALFIVPTLLQPDDIEMIDVEGMEYEEAFSDLTKLGFEVKREPITSDTVTEGLVVRTEPESGMTVKEKTEVTVYTSRGKKRVAFDDYVGEDYERTKQELEDQGYGSVLAIEENSDRPEGEIIEHVQPKPDEEVVPEEMSVIFKVSLGPPTVTIRSLEGQSRESAENYLNENNLESSVTEEYSEEIPKGSIIRQEPQALSEVDVGSTVNLVVSLGPEDQPPQEKTVQVEVPYDEEAEQKEQQVLIYVNDSNNQISEVLREETITEDTTVEFTVTIPPDGEASYKVQLGEEVIEEETVPYEEGE